MSTTLDITLHGSVETRPKRAGMVARWLESLRDMHDRRVARRELAHVPAHLLEDVGIDAGRIDEVVDRMIAARRAARGQV